jgi:hypothetical protein
VWRRSLWLNWITEQPIGIGSWAIGIGALTAVEAAVIPTALRIVDSSGGPLVKFLEKHGGLLTTNQYLSFLMSFTALLVAGFVVARVADGRATLHNTATTWYSLSRYPCGDC